MRPVLSITIADFALAIRRLASSSQASQETLRPSARPMARTGSGQTSRPASAGNGTVRS